MSEGSLEAPIRHPIDWKSDQYWDKADLEAELERVFVSRGGMDATEAIDTRSSSGRFTRRRNLLENEHFIMEGVQLAFHPMIEMKDWPGNP